MRHRHPYDLDAVMDSLGIHRDALGNRLYTVGEYAFCSGVKYSTARKRVTANKVDNVRVNGKPWIYARELADAIEEQVGDQPTFAYVLTDSEDFYHLTKAIVGDAREVVWWDGLKPQMKSSWLIYDFISAPERCSQLSEINAKRTRVNNPRRSLALFRRRAGVPSPNGNYFRQCFNEREVVDMFDVVIKSVKLMASVY